MAVELRPHSTATSTATTTAIFQKIKNFLKSNPTNSFCSEFSTDYFDVVCFGLPLTTYAKIGKNLNFKCVGVSFESVVEKRQNEP